MNPNADGIKRSSNGVSIPRWAALILAPLAWFVAIPLAHGVVPWAISRMTRRYGWSEGPGAWNLLGVIPIGLGAALLLWVLIVGMRQIPKRARLGLTPPVLMMTGPYTFTRNPMYVAEIAIWFGWAVFFGSIGVFAAALVLGAIVSCTVVPLEERTLERAFGQGYLEFKNRTRRWL